VETRGGVGKSSVLEHKSGNISETRKGRGKVTMESLFKANYQESNMAGMIMLWMPRYLLVMPTNYGVSGANQRMVIFSTLCSTPELSINMQYAIVVDMKLVCKQIL